MSLSQSSRRILTTLAVVLSSLALVDLAVADTAVAQEEPPLQTLRAPFTCGTEWSGGTRSGHGLNDWNLDINSTSRTYSDPNHALDHPLLAQANGTVVWIGWHYAAGTYVEIDYGDITARYIHVVDDSVPSELEIGSVVAQGDLFGLLGDSGNATHAHLHLEYFDSRDYEDSRAWVIPKSNQIQIAMDDNPIDPGEVFVSTNCDGEPPVVTSTTAAATTTTTEPPHPFTDVDTDSFAYDDIALLYELAITEGTDTASYSPGQTVDREQMAAFLARIWRILSPDTVPATAPDGEYPFDDVDPSSFAYDDIRLIFGLGITTGTGQTTYSPGREVSREQMAAFLNRLYELADADLATAHAPEPEPIVGAYPFEDVAPSSFAYDDIADIYQLGITTGTSASTYSPAERVDREQMAAFLARVYRELTPTSE